MKFPTTKSTNPVVILRTVARVMLQESRRYDQSTWLEQRGVGGSIGSSFESHATAYPNSVPACGTVGCVAGLACAVKQLGVKQIHEVQPAAAAILRLNLDQAKELFSGGALDEKANGMPRTNTPESGTRAYAKLGVAHIRRFVKKHYGQDLGV